MTPIELAEIARMVFSEKYVGKVLRAYRPTGQGVEIDVVFLEQAEPLLDIQFNDTCIEKRLVAQPLHGKEADPVKAFNTCLEADVLDALIITNEELPQFDRMAPRVCEPREARADRRTLGWLYHLEADKTLTVYECGGKPPQLTQVRRGQLTAF
ncbi:MAG: hypothetical protein ACYDBJ_10540 [Aggregatilineales bacterium]